MKLELFLICGFKLTLGACHLIKGEDARGIYFKVKWPGYTTYIRELK